MATSSADRGRFYLNEGLDFIVDQPLAYLHLLYRKFRLFWHAFEIPVSVDIHFYEAHSRLSYLNLFGFGIVAPLALVGLVWNWNRWQPIRLTLRFWTILLGLGPTLYGVRSLSASCGAFSDAFRR